LKIFNLINELSNIGRWSQAHCNRRESVLEHTAFVSMFALHLTTYIDCDTEEVLRRAIIHDVDETITGDIVTTTKYNNSALTEELMNLEVKAAAEISELYFNSELLFSWRNAKDDSIEGDIIKVSDAAGVVYKIWQEVRSGNIEFLKYKDNIIFSLENISVNSRTEVTKISDELIEMVRSI